jgi:transcriptional regulator with XRE-family HTH domain
MTADEFTTALDVLGWKQSDLARRLDLDKNTPSRWANGRTPVPGWAGEYMRAMLALQRLHAEFVQVPRGHGVPPGAESGPDGQASRSGPLI